MAYGVKYRLIFSDVLGNGKKVEILKKDYTGDVLPMIGGANPVQISWQSSDDFYKPIIGSKCTLSLLVTDSVTYDDFYKFDEREYKVVVSYAKSQGEIFADRVLDDSGTVESFECVDNVLNDFETISTYYQNRVIDDGGDVESLSCVADAITDDNFYRWGAYWSGFLVVDRYKEKLTTTPFGITINAFDGLGTLNNFNGPTSYNNNNAPSAPDNLTRIQEILDNLDLDLDIYIATDIVFNFIGTNYDFEDYGSLSGLSEITGAGNIVDAKKQLENILNNFNLRIYQSYNRWYIVEASNIFDYYVKDQIYNEVQSTGVVPTGIRERITTQLNNTKKEFIDFRTYDKDATSLGTERLPVLYDNNNELKAINNDLAREYLQPVSEVVLKSNFPKVSVSGTDGFEYGSYGYTIIDILEPTYPFDPIGPAAEIATDEIALGGRRSMKLTDIVPTTGVQRCFTKTSTITFSKNSYSDFEVKINYYVKLLSSSVIGITNSFQFQITTSDDDGLKYWDAVEKEFVSGVHTNAIQSTNINKFVEYSTKLDEQGLNLDPTATSTLISVYICNTLISSSDYETTYFDNFQINISKEEANTTDQNFTSKLTNAGTKTSIKERKDVPVIYPAYYRTRDNYGVWNGVNLWRGLTDIINQNIANDFREFSTRYEGTFRNLKVQPLSMHNKVWFYWTGQETDPQSTIIDGLKYDVKNAAFKIKSHLPNDDDDESIDFIIN